MDKRGLSSLVVTIITVVLSLVAIVIVWEAVFWILDSSRDKIILGQSNVDFELSSFLFNDSGASLNVGRLAGPGQMLGLKFVFFDGRSSEIIDRTIYLEELEEKAFSFNFKKLNGSTLKTVSVAPIFEVSNGKNKTVDIVDSYAIQSKDFVKNYVVEESDDLLGY